ncbi:YitT family protein [Mycoplasma sp. Pen4]|nr:YitT family protein [Mycoplasma sp. Pen4]
MNIIIVLIAVLIGSWLPGSILLNTAQKDAYEATMIGTWNVELFIKHFNIEDETVIKHLNDLVNKDNVAANIANNTFTATFFNDSVVSPIVGSADVTKLQVEWAGVIGERQKLIDTLHKYAYGFELYLSPNFIATILSNVFYISVLDKLFPKFKLVRVEIFSAKSSEIQNRINSDNKIVQGMTIFQAKGGFKGEDVNVITSIGLFRQLLRIIKDVRDIDQDAFIAVSNVRSVDGNVYLPQDKF